MAKLSDLRIPKIDRLEVNVASDSNLNSTESTQSPLGDVVFQLNLDWSTLWKKSASLDEVSNEKRKEIVYEVLSQVSSLMRSKYGRSETQDYEMIVFEENSVVVEYPLLRGMS